MIRFIFWAIFFYLFIRFIVNFILPVYKATRQMKQHVRDFNDKMGQQDPQSFNGQSKPPEKAKSNDYIDFEEIKG